MAENENDTITLANEFAEFIKPGDLILLNGELGSGKTFFVKHVCEQFGITNVSSPSFAIVNEYNGKRKIYHFDFYRIKKVSELYDFGIEDYLIDEEAITFIEWADLWREILPNKFFKVDFQFVNEHKRKISIEKK
jgi:tRNA threonylcarbamoyladenosine biosynthesis protein TsaE